jgi:hypothetical protein
LHPACNAAQRARWHLRWSSRKAVQSGLSSNTGLIAAELAARSAPSGSIAHNADNGRIAGAPRRNMRPLPAYPLPLSVIIEFQMAASSWNTTANRRKLMPTIMAAQLCSMKAQGTQTCLLVSPSS